MYTRVTATPTVNILILVCVFISFLWETSYPCTWQQDRSAPRLHFIVFTSGIVFSRWVFAGSSNQWSLLNFFNMHAANFLFISDRFNYDALNIFNLKNMAWWKRVLAQETETLLNSFSSTMTWLLDTHCVKSLHEVDYHVKLAQLLRMAGFA